MNEWHAVDGIEGVKVRYNTNAAGRLIISGLCVEREAVTSEFLRQIPLGRIEAAANLGSSQPDAITDLPPLRRDGLTSDEFSKLVTRHYRAWAQVSARPGTEMARANGAKVPTVHTWIREARLRGHLPPGQRGKAA